MCIQSCKSSSFLKPTTRLNPSAHEWKPPLLTAPAPPPPQTAVPLAAHLPQKLVWHLPQSNFYYYHPMHLHVSYIPRAFPHIVHHPPPFTFPAPAPPLCDGAKKDVSQLKVKDVEHCEKIMRPIFKERSEVVKPLVRWQWRVKKTVADGGAAASPPPPLPATSYSSRTTVMVRNIPNQLRRDFMVEFVDSYCDVHSLEYDFMYLPMDFRRKDNLGYAFVNFTSGRDALKFKKIVNNYKWGVIKTDEGKPYTSKKICAITWARIQGKEKLVERFEDSVFACDNVEYLPVVFDPPRAGGSSTTSPAVVGRIGGQVSKSV